MKNSAEQLLSSANFGLSAVEAAGGGRQTLRSLDLSGRDEGFVSMGVRPETVLFDNADTVKPTNPTATREYLKAVRESGIRRGRIGRHGRGRRKS
ncbi:MAG TPA: hypothetical protein VNA13_04605 [Xanthomonadales bacterium]|nr:hypothetical protein [Xanthomonadales bacterium]